MKDDSNKVSEFIFVCCDLVLLNILWLVFCFPVVTIGASTAALHNVIKKITFKENYSVWSDFWKSFKENARQSSIVFFFLAMAAAICVSDLYIGMNSEDEFGAVSTVIGFIGLYLAFSTWIIACTLMVRYEVNSAKLIRNALLIGLMNPHIPIAGVTAAALFPALSLINISFGVVSIPLWIAGGGALPAFIVQTLMRKVYKRIETENDNRKESQHVDSQA